MRNRRPALDHTEAVARRLAELSAELEAERAAEALPFDTEGDLAPADPEHTMHRLPVLDAPVARDPFAPAPPPGRHAARRRTPPGDDTGEPDPGGWGPGQVGVVLGGVVLALAVTCLWLLLGTTQEVVTPVAARVATSSATSPAVADATPGASASASASPAPGAGDRTVAAQNSAEVVVDVSGKVRRPGLVVLPSGSRVADALERAGGARAGVDLTGINLARVLVDGEQILVGVDPVPGAAASAPPGGVGPAAGPAAAPGAPGSGPVSINSADAALLDSLPGVGPVTASAIIDWRTQHGGFTDVRDLLEVKGIGEATLAELLPHVTL